MKSLNCLASGTALMLLLLSSASIGAAENLKIESYQCFDSRGKTRVETIDNLQLNVCQVGDSVTVKISNLEKWMQAHPENPTLDKLVLALDGQLLTGNHGRPTELGLIFELTRRQQNESNMAAWRTLLTQTRLFETEIMTIAIALEGSVERYGEKKIGIKVASAFRMLIVALFYLVLILLFFWLVRSKGLLRDPGIQPPDGMKPFSLGSTQMAFWFFIVIGGFMYVWLVVGDLAVLTPGVLGLIGISSATGLVATAVASSKKPALQAELSKLDKEKVVLDTRLSELKVQIEAVPAPANLESLRIEKAQQEQRSVEIVANIGNLTRTPKSVSFFQDILSNSGEMSLPRFQMVGWTLALGIVFVHSVFTTLNMPEFDATLLSLMGLSSGTYVGFKIPGTAGK